MTDASPTERGDDSPAAAPNDLPARFAWLPGFIRTYNWGRWWLSAAIAAWCANALASERHSVLFPQRISTALKVVLLVFYTMLAIAQFIDWRRRRRAAR